MAKFGPNDWLSGTRQSDGGYAPSIEASQAPVTLTDDSIASLSAGQAAGTSVILAANTSRRALVIDPPADCLLTFTSGGTTGYRLFANVPNGVTPVPTNALYISGLAAGQAVTILEG